MQPGLRGQSVRNSPVNTGSGKNRGRRRCNRDSPAASGGGQGSRYFPAAWGEDHAGAIIRTTASGELHSEQGGIPRRNYGIWRDHAEARERCEKEGAAERNWYGLTPALHFPSPLCYWGWERDKEEAGVKLRLRRGQEGRCCSVCFSQSKSILIGELFFPWL